MRPRQQSSRPLSLSRWRHAYSACLARASRLRRSVLMAESMADEGTHVSRDEVPCPCMAPGSHVIVRAGSVALQCLAMAHKVHWAGASGGRRAGDPTLVSALKRVVLLSGPPGGRRADGPARAAGRRQRGGAARRGAARGRAAGAGRAAAVHGVLHARAGARGRAHRRRPAAGAATARVWARGWAAWGLAGVVHGWHAWFQSQTL